jgi:hypothetical protein
MKSSLSFVVPSAIAILSTTLLCSLSSTAMSQTATGDAAPLPSITVVAPKQLARPQRVARPPQRPAQAATAASRPTAPTPQTPPPAQGSVLAKLAVLEKTSSNCTDGCQTSFKDGNQPWNGCSLGGGFNFSATCRNVRNFKTYVECRDYGVFLAWRDTEIWWYCSSLLGGGKYKVAERSGPR